MYEKRLEQNMAPLTARLFELYGSRWDFYRILESLDSLMKKAYSERSDALKSIDEKNEAWYLNQNTVGMMLYVDLFSENLKALVNEIPYFKKLGVNYIHLMPLFDCPKKENDGGYAISSYSKVQKKLGTIDDLKSIAGEFHANGIKLVLDFVFNHTSDEHKWALEAKKGNPVYQNYYYMYDDKNEVDQWNSTLREIFPTVRRGSFTYYESLKKWVWTTFNSFQWDLNYSNPEVFLAMCREMLNLANLGVDVLRLDALAFVWKEKGTVCESLPKAHTLIQCFQYVAKIVCPSLEFKSEAIVHPDQVVQYIKKEECSLSYNPLQMALFWSTLATRDTRLLTKSLKKRWYIPEGCAWVNYIRCHDDIGWTFSDDDASELGINGYDHRKFLNRFFTGRFDGSYACGEPFQLNPTTGDCRICGTMASLSGLEQAQAMNNSLYKKMAVARMKMMYSVLLALPGIPLLYAGDEEAVFNDYGYRNDPSKKEDSRWVHRIKRTKDGENASLEQKEFSDHLAKTIALRKTLPQLGGSNIEFYDTQDSRIFAFKRNGIHVIANFSEAEAWHRAYSKSRWCQNLLDGKIVDCNESIRLEPYQVMWLKEEQQ